MTAPTLADPPTAQIKAQPRSLPRSVCARMTHLNLALATMCEIIDFLAPRKKGLYPHLLLRDNSCPEAGVVSAALAGGSELLRQDLCAELTTLNHYGLDGVGCALVDWLFALAVRSKRVVSAIRGSVAD
jgi:hypothetical protein